MESDMATKAVLFVALLGMVSAEPVAEPVSEAVADKDHPHAPHIPNYHNHHSVYVARPYQHVYCDATVAPTCVDNSTLSYCLEDEEYPEYELKAWIHADPIFAKKYADVPDQSADDLVEGITKDQEAGFDYSFYTGASTGDSPYDLSHWTGPEGYLCPSDVVYGMPKRARNVEGKWRVIINNVHYFTQTVRMETCQFPAAACRALPPCYNSSCTQKSVHHRLLSWDPCNPYKGIFIDSYKLPSACSCYIPESH
ncbi:unnamed protein product [Meganyctiphanes norvegica]|uniref:Spaetzle domain-containing protein n=1 Tax=Meganyctiphanes norvegica TaxID=48144 RepID=A0AAV2R7K7_MEGNR